MLTFALRATCAGTARAKRLSLRREAGGRWLGGFQCRSSASSAFCTMRFVDPDVTVITTGRDWLTKGGIMWWGIGFGAVLYLVWRSLSG